MSSSKSYWRKLYKEKRKRLSEIELQKLSSQICERAFNWLLENDSIQKTHIFLPIKAQMEVDTIPLLKSLWKRGFETYTSMVDVSSDDLLTITLEPNSQFVLDKWGIPLPVEFEEIENPVLDLIFVPLLAYDQKGMRLGFGRGYYDRFFDGLSNNPIKVGLSFFEPEEMLPSEEHDIPLDFCITPTKVLTF